VQKLQKKRRRRLDVRDDELSVMLKLGRERTRPALKSSVKSVQHAMSKRRPVDDNPCKNTLQKSWNNGDSKALLLLIQLQILILILNLL
jgi:hypothetical protein